MIQTFDIPGRLDGLNEVIGRNRASWRAGAALKRDNQQRVCDAIRAAGIEPVSGAVHIHTLWVEGAKPGAKRFVPRDKDNIRSAVKFVLDALVECDVLKDDGWSYISGLSDSYQLNRNSPHIVVTIESEGR